MDFVLPKAFEEKMKKLLAEEWAAFLQSYQNNRFQAMRFNSLKGALTEEKEKEVGGTFHIQEGDRVDWSLHSYYYGGEERPGKHAYHEMGVYYIQEPSAMSAAAVLAPIPGMKVLDLCAAPGGKSTQLGAMLEGKGLLVANEINAARCKILSQNIERMGITNAIVTNEDSERLANHFGNFFHAILVDAPCSGEGMFRKNPEAMEEWSPDNVALCARRQREILDNGARMLYPGGRMVYSTCTFSPEENEQTIGDFLKRHPEFDLLPIEQEAFSDARPEWIEDKEISEEIRADILKTKRLWPHKLSGEGHYVALLQKKGNLPALLEASDTAGEYSGLDMGKSKKKKGKKQKESSNGNEEQLLEEFLSDTFGEDTYSWIKKGNMKKFGDQIYRLPPMEISLDGIRVLRAGLHLGEFKKNRLEPSHALALALSRDQFVNWVNLSLEDQRVRGFFRGESIQLSEGDMVTSEKGKGWCVVCVNGMTAGWGKLAGQQVKNHYPKGLRKEL